MPLDDNVDFKVIAEKINGYSGADIKELFRKTGLYALRRIYNLRRQNNNLNIVTINIKI